MDKDGLHNGFIGVHIGAGQHSEARTGLYLEICAAACQAGINVLRDGGSALDAAECATMILEDAGETNAGYGSNLTESGTIEMDAGLMDGTSLLFGAVGAITEVKNPIQVARKLVDEQKLGLLPLGRVPPGFLVGEGAKEWAARHGIQTVKSENLISDKAAKLYKHYKKKLDLYKLSVEENMKRKQGDGSSFNSCKRLRTAQHLSLAEHVRSNDGATRLLDGNSIDFEDSNQMYRNLYEVTIDRINPTDEQSTSGCNIVPFLQNPYTVSHSLSHLPQANARLQYTAANHIPSSSNQSAQAQPPPSNTKHLARYSHGSSNNSTPQINTQGKCDLTPQHSMNKFALENPFNTGDVSVEPGDLLIATSTHGDLMLGQGDLLISTEGTNHRTETLNNELKSVNVDSCNPIPAPHLHHDYIRKHENQHQDNDGKQDEDDLPVEDDRVQDTVGVVVLDREGHVAASVSSGGIALKQSGRVGQASCYGCGCWAQRPIKKDSCSVGVSTTGCGEHLVRTLLAKECGQGLANSTTPMDTLQSIMKEKFAESEFLSGLNEKLGGAICMQFNKETGTGNFLWTHTTASMGIGFQTTGEAEATVKMSRLPKPSTNQGTTILVESVSFKTED